MNDTDDAAPNTPAGPPAGRKIDLTRERALGAAGAVTAVLIVVIALLARSCSSRESLSPDGTAAPATEAPTTVPPPAIPVWPLTGLLAHPTDKDTPAVAVKVDNSPQGRPHAGFNQADLVYELQVESITRFIQVYHSSVPDRVGPVRSARSSDIDLMFGLGTPLLVWSGGNPGVTGAINGAQEAGGLTNAGVSSGAGGHYYRDRGRSAPHNLYANPRAIKDELGMGAGGAPGEVFKHAPPGSTPAGAAPAAGVVINFGGGVTVRYVWDAERTGWDRFQTDQRHGFDRSAVVDEGGEQVAPENVVVLFVPYVPDPIDSRSPLALSVGDGTGLVFTNGTVSLVHWTRATNRDGWNLTREGTTEPVALGAGRSWVALVPAWQGDAALMDAGEAASLLGVRA